ncbi:hypothetical protein [Bacillus rubiinfantis]|uniref:hypothetical protein n=1 Tax=Bacillus rubiinfantis TaxID=1499680 RepID=UPI000AB11F2F|nr:hypothetical protein [Bacillus rubiinfantis]
MTTEHPGDDDDPVSQNGYTYANNNSVVQIYPQGTAAFAAAAGGFVWIPGF